MLSRRAHLQRLLLCGWLIHAVCAVAHAEPTVRVRGESRIELGVAHHSRGITIRGALRDELGVPLSARELTIEAIPEDAPQEPWASEVATDMSGRFALEIRDSSRNYRLLATYVGDEAHRGVRVERNVERARADVRLELRLATGARIDLDRESFVVDVMAESDAGGDDLTMRLTDELGHELTSAKTQADGKLRLVVPTTRLGPPGAGVLRLESLSDARRAEAQTEARVVRTRAVTLALSSHKQTYEAGTPIPIAGRVFTRIGARAGVPVGLFAGSRHLETLVSDDAGRFATELWLGSAAGPVELVARTEGDAASAYAPAQTALSLIVIEPKPLPLYVLLAPALIVAIALAWIAHIQTRRRHADVALHTANTATTDRVLSRKPHGRRDRLRIDGLVLDLRSGAPLAQAKLSLFHAQDEAAYALSCDAAGHFSSPILPPGRSRLRVECPGYGTTELVLDMPHRGEWTAFVVRLESLRERALIPFQRLALRALPSTRAWAVWTMREVREWMTHTAPESGAGLGALVGDVERACYGPKPPSEAEVSSIEQRVTDLEREQSAPNRTDPAPESRAMR